MKYPNLIHKCHRNIIRALRSLLICQNANTSFIHFTKSFMFNTITHYPYDLLANR